MGGGWNEADATIDLSLPAAYYQTRWFAALCASASAFALCGAYVLRLRLMATIEVIVPAARAYPPATSAHRGWWHPWRSAGAAP